MIISPKSHDAIFKLPCGGKESPKGIRNRSHPGVSSIWDGVHEWCGRLAFQSRPTGFTFSRCHDRHDPTSVMANRGHWMLLHSIEVLGTCKLHIFCSAKSANSEINGWSVDDQLMISWWLERNCWVIWGCNGRNRRRALGQFGSRSSGRQLWNTTVSCHKKSALILKKYALLIQTKKFFRMLLWAPT